MVVVWWCDGGGGGSGRVGTCSVFEAIKRQGQYCSARCSGFERVHQDDTHFSVPVLCSETKLHWKVARLCLQTDRQASKQASRQASRQAAAAASRQNGAVVVVVVVCQGVDDAVGDVAGDVYSSSRR
ncbi:hypothetical protein M0802_005503 [Mischocyttarus mexicanus]|nr:hypothetical protein M0802_005503 [Mischocyttarus mexicanus]